MSTLGSASFSLVAGGVRCRHHSVRVSLSLSVSLGLQLCLSFFVSLGFFLLATAVRIPEASARPGRHGLYRALWDSAVEPVEAGDRHVQARQANRWCPCQKPSDAKTLEGNQSG